LATDSGKSMGEAASGPCSTIARNNSSVTAGEPKLVEVTTAAASPKDWERSKPASSMAIAAAATPYLESQLIRRAARGER
jgi:hypothetical protein